MFNVYVPGEGGDAVLLHWYLHLVKTNDLHKIVGPSMYSLASFMKQFTDPRTRLYYLYDDEGWWIVAWTFPLGSGASWGLWVREDKRASGTRAGLAFIMSTLADSLATYPVLLNLAKDPAIVAKTKRLGYAYLGCVPYLYDGDDAHLMYMTREMFAPLMERWEARHGR